MAKQSDISRRHMLAMSAAGLRLAGRARPRRRQSGSKNLLRKLDASSPRPRD